MLSNSNNFTITSNLMANSIKQAIVNREQITKFEVEFLEDLQKYDETFASVEIKKGTVIIWQQYGKEFFECNFLEFKFAEFEELFDKKEPIKELLNKFENMERI